MEDQPQPTVTGTPAVDPANIPAPVVSPTPPPTALVMPSEPETAETADEAVEDVASEATESEDELVDAETDEDALPADQLEEPISWEASEYVHHTKGVGWYFGLGAVVTVLLVMAAVLHSWLGIGVFLVMGVAIAVYAQKPPRILTYQLDGLNVTIDGKSYPYSTFRSYGVLSDTEWHAIDLEPTQRFMPRLTVLFGDDDFDLIVDHLSLHLPRMDRQPDVIERISRYLRF